MTSMGTALSQDTRPGSAEAPTSAMPSSIFDDTPRWPMLGPVAMATLLVGSALRRRNGSAVQGRSRNDRAASWHVLAYPGFRLYFAGSVISNSGTWLQNTAQALLAYRLTHSVLAVGVVVCAQFSAVLVLGPWAGTVVARARSLPGLLITTQLTSAVVVGMLGVLQFSHMLNDTVLVAGAFLLGVAYCFSLPALPVLTPALVPEGEVRAAMAMNSVSYNLGRAAAPLAAVVVIGTIGFAWAFFLNAASFFVFAVVLRAVRPQHLPPPIKSPRIMDGFRAARNERSIWVLLAMVAAVTIAGDPVIVLGPSLAHGFGMASTYAGYLLSAIGFGTVLGSFIPVRPPQRLRHAAYPLAGLGIAVFIFALGINPLVCLLMAFLVGVACLLTGAVTQTLLLACAGPSRAAVVMAAWAVAWAGSKPIASLADGLIARFAGVHAAGMLLALPALVPAALILILEGRTRPTKSAEAAPTGSEGQRRPAHEDDPLHDREPADAPTAGVGAVAAAL